MFLINELAITELASEGHWVTTSKLVEEKEHSLEMHLPYIRKIFGE